MVSSITFPFDKLPMATVIEGRSLSVAAGVVLYVALMANASYHLHNAHDWRWFHSAPRVVRRSALMQVVLYSALMHTASLPDRQGQLCEGRH